MTFIDSKTTVSVILEQKEKIRAECGKNMTALNKSETYEKELSVSANAIYVTYHPISD